MKYEILRQEEDLAGKIRVWVDTGKETQVLKFSKIPTETEIRAEVDKFLSAKEINKQSEIEAIDREIIRLQERKQQLEKGG